MKYTVIRDGREKEKFGWNFDPSDTCEGTVKGSLNTGDYSLKGYEKIFTIERKANTGEIAVNIYEKRFIDELKRLQEFKHAFLVMEFTMADVMTFPINSGIPKYLWPKINTTPQYLLKTLIEYQIKYGINIIYAGDHGSQVASSIFKRIIENVTKPGIST